MGTIEMEKIDLPTFKPTGDIYDLALLIDFNDNEGKLPLIITTDSFLPRLISYGKSEGLLQDKSVMAKSILWAKFPAWHRMPEDYSYYVGNKSGGDPDGYPHNSKRMMEDAVNVTLQKDNTNKWDDYDLQKRDIIDALYVGTCWPGAEAQSITEGRVKNIWSH